MKVHFFVECDKNETILGAQNYEEAVGFIKMKFAELNQHPDKSVFSAPFIQFITVFFVQENNLYA